MSEAQKRYRIKPGVKERRKVYMSQYTARADKKLRANQVNRKKYRDNLEYREHAKAYIRARYAHYKINHTLTQWEALKTIYGYRCAYCGRKLKKLTKDHLIPISKGDPDNVDSIENIVPACKSCNSRKNNKPPFPFQMIMATDIIMPSARERIERLLQ